MSDAITVRRDPPLQPGVRKTASMFSDVSQSISSEYSASTWAGPGFDAELAESVASLPSSDRAFADPSQTMIILDWDDTLFPTTEFLDRWQVACPAEHVYAPKEPERAQELQHWKQSLRQLLERACAVSDKVVILTNSRRPWVSDCLGRFAPDLLPLFQRKHRAPKVVYASEHARRLRSYRSESRPTQHQGDNFCPEEQRSEMTAFKLAAMRREVKAFYSRYPSQSWKNIVSIGDMPFERDAIEELAFQRVAPGPEKLRTKKVLEPAEPTLTELTLRLRYSTALLPAYIAFDGDLNLDLAEAQELAPAVLADAMQMNGLNYLGLSGHAWGCGPAPRHFDAELTAEDLDFFVHSELMQ